jgi:Protein of unknown function (DUF3187)
VRSALITVCAALVASCPWPRTSCAQEEAEPLHIRNLNPAVAIFGLPAWDVPVRGTRLGLTAELANHYRLSQRGAELFVLDGETLRTTLSFDRSVGEHWFFGVDVPYFRVSGGVLDNLIDGWHSLFNLPDGGRNVRPDNALLFELGDPNGNVFLLNRPQTGLGDVQIKAGRPIGRRGRFAVEGALKLPTGAERMLAGSGSTDFSLTLLRSQTLTVRNRPAGYYWGFGVIHAGKPDRVPFDANRGVYTGVVGGSWKVWPKWGLKAQMDVHGPFYRSDFEEIGATAIQATVAASLKRSSGAVFDFAVVEDLEVSTAPDVVVQMAMRWQW